MNYSPLQLDIIRIFGKKNLSFGCIIKYSGSPYIFLDERIGHYIGYLVDDLDGVRGYEEIKRKDKVRIIGHLPTLEDIFRVAEEKGLFCEIIVSRFTDNLILFILNEYGDTIKSIQYNPSRSPLEQSKETLLQLKQVFS